MNADTVTMSRENYDAMQNKIATLIKYKEKHTIVVEHGIFSKTCENQELIRTKVEFEIEFARIKNLRFFQLLKWKNENR